MLEGRIGSVGERSILEVVKMVLYSAKLVGRVPFSDRFYVMKTIIILSHFKFFQTRIVILEQWFVNMKSINGGYFDLKLKALTIPADKKFKENS